MHKFYQSLADGIINRIGKEIEATKFNESVYFWTGLCVCFLGFSAPTEGLACSWHLPKRNSSKDNAEKGDRGIYV